MRSFVGQKRAGQDRKEGCEGTHHSVIVGGVCLDLLKMVDHDKKTLSEWLKGKYAKLISFDVGELELLVGARDLSRIPRLEQPYFGQYCKGCVLATLNRKVGNLHWVTCNQVTQRG